MELFTEILLSISGFIIMTVFFLTVSIAPVFYGGYLIKYYIEIISYDFIEAIGGIFLGLLFITLGLYITCLIILY